MTLARPAVLTAFIILLFGGASPGPPLRAQALVTASKVGDLSVFGGYTRSWPDYNPAQANGYTFGGDFTFLRLWRLDTGVEARYDHTYTSAITEHAILFGPRATIDYHRYHPYADFLIGTGGIAYNPPPYFSPNDHADGGVTLAAGGGVDIDLTPRFALKLDYQQQHINMGINPPFKPSGGNYTLTPQNVTVGLVYHFNVFGLSGLRKQRELH